MKSSLVAWGRPFEKAAELLSNRVAFSLEASVSQTNHSIASRLERRVTGTITLEGSAMPVIGKAIKLNDQSLLRPEGIDLVVENQDVEAGGRESLSSAERGEAILQRGTRRSWRLCSCNQVANGAQRPPSSTARANSGHCIQFQQAQTVRLLECSFELMLAHDLCQVEKRSSNGCDRNRVDNQPVFLIDPAFVNRDARPSSSLLRGDLDQ